MAEIVKAVVMYAVVPTGAVLAEGYGISRHINRLQRDENTNLVPVPYVLLKEDKFTLAQTEEILTAGGYVFDTADQVHDWLVSAM